MTPVQTTTAITQSPNMNGARAVQPPPIRTRSETVECNCPEQCERDHEVD